MIFEDTGGMQVQIKRVLVAIISSIGLIATSFGSSAGAAEIEDPHLLTLNNYNMPPAYNQVYTWLENNTVSVPFSINPFDLRTQGIDIKYVQQDYKTVLPKCRQATDAGCLSTVEYSVDAGLTWLAAEPISSPGQREVAFSRFENGNFVRTYTSTYPADTAKGVWEASLPNYWKLPGANHAIGDRYFINAVTRSAINPAGKSVMTGIEFVAYAGEVRAKYSNQECKYWDVHTKDQSRDPSDSYCFEAVNLPESLLLRTKVNLGSRITELSGWFDGRLSDALIDFGTAVPGQILVQGRPMAVNVVQTVNIPKGDPEYKVDAEIEKIQLPYGTRGAFTPADGINSFIEHLSKIPDKAFARNTNWRVSSWQQAESVANCKGKPGVKGVVLTNATTYDSAPPVFNSSKLSLEFKVASSHLNPNGSLNSGEYKLLVQSAIADCLWKSNLNATATVSIYDDGGAQTIATTSYAKSKDWATFSAAGFHFSAPTISVSLRQKTKTITCVKITNKKISKKISGIAPKCPTGYKAK
jgi:hypothetical protein